MFRNLCTFAVACVLMAMSFAQGGNAEFDKVITDHKAAYNEWVQSSDRSSEKYYAIFDATIGKIDFTTLELSQFERLVQERILPNAKATEAASKRLGQIEMYGTGIEPFRACAIRFQVLGQGGSEKERAHCFAMLMANPYTVAQNIEDPVVQAALSSTYGISSEIVEPQAWKLRAAADAVLESADSARTVYTMVSVLDNARKAMKDTQQAEATRQKAVKLAKGAISMLEGQDDSASESLRSAASRMAEYLDGPAARGTLIGNAMPAIDITWSSDPGFNGFEDLLGKVVIIDFWATWCGPCISSFPNVNELVDRYKGYDVVVVGITSLQGFHMGAGGRVDTKDSPAKEYELMPSFMKEKNMNWIVAFGEQDVFNPQFGVRGIPHVAIISPDGTVVENGLHPASNAEHKYEVIDGLLEKFGKAAPGN